MTVTIIEALDCGEDVLLVRGHIDGLTVEVPAPTEDDPDATEEVSVVVEARGWISAMANHYPADAYDDEGNLADDAQPRAMTKAERRAYAERLLLASVPEPVAEPTPVNL